MRRDGVEFAHHFSGLELVRVMVWTDYLMGVPGVPRVFMRRIHRDDPRPLGRECLPASKRTDWYRGLALNQWSHVIYGDTGSDEIAGPKGVLP